MPNDDPSRPYTRAEAAAYLGVSTKSISNYVRDGLLAPKRGPRRVYFTLEDLRGFLDRYGEASA